MKSVIGPGRKRVLLLCHYYPGAAGAIIDHIQAFGKFSINEYFILSNLGDIPDWLDLCRFDALVFHYSLVASYDNYISPQGRKRIREFLGFKAAFVQDDYRWINDTVNAFAYMRIHALFPLAGKDIIDIVYSPEKLPRVRKETVLAGYVPQDLVDRIVVPYRDRRLDVGYRARKLPAWMGSHTLQKWQIAERFADDARRYDLKVDISCLEEDRIYGDHWIDFVSNCKAILGTESGASICDFTGDIQRNVETHLLKYPEADFETLRNLYFKEEDCKFMMNVISPRCFEAAALRTLMILYEGDYSGVLIPWRHYLPLKRDHSNMDDVVRLLQSPVEAQEIIDNAYTEVAKSAAYSYRAMVELVDRVMEEEWSPTFVPARHGFLKEEFQWLKEKNPRLPSKVQSPQVDMALCFHVTQASGQSSRSAFDGGATRKPSPAVTEIALKSGTAVKTIAIRWNVADAGAPESFELQGLQEGRLMYAETVLNSGRNEFQLVSMPLKSPAVNLLRLEVLPIRGASVANPLSVAILTKETVLRRRWLFGVKRIAVVVVVNSWHALPEPIRARLRPFVGRVRIKLRSLFGRMLG